MTIRHGDYGIRSSAGNVNVLNCTLYYNGYDGTPLPDPITAENMVTLWNTNCTNGGAIRIENSAASEIAYCTVYDNDRGIRFQDGDNGNIHHNTVNNNFQAGIYLAASSYTGATGCSNTQVHDNNSYQNYEHGVLSIGGINNTITDNELYDNWNCGVMLWHPSEIVVQDNTVTGNNLHDFIGAGTAADDEGGIWVAGGTGATGSTFDCNIIGNTISDNQLGGALQANGIKISDSPGNGIEITGNALTNHDIDILLLSQAATTTVNENEFDGSDFGIQNDDTTATLDAEYNWWGDASGPYHSSNPDGLGDEVSDDVDFTPWYGSESMVAPVVVYIDDTNDIRAVSETIQGGVDAAELGDTITVHAGTYNEAVTIDKELTLLGETHDVCKKDFTLPATLGDYDDTAQSIIKAPGPNDDDANDEGADDNANAVTITSSNVVLKGFVIEALERGEYSGNTYNNLVELRPSGQEATMTGIVIENNVIGPGTDTATQTNGRHGLRLTAGYGHTISADVTCNKIHGTYGNGNNVFIWGTAYGTTGIPPAGPGPADLSGTVIQNNDICNSARSGVELSGAQFGATITSNRIHDNGAGHEGEDADLKYGEGIAFVRDYIDVHWDEGQTLGKDAGYVDDVTVTNNEIYDNDKNGIYMGPMNKNHVITGNDIHDNGNPARGGGSTFGPGDGIRIDLNGDYYLTWDWGALYDVTSNIVANASKIENNIGYGAQILGTPTNSFVLDATYNYWGDVSGPNDPCGINETDGATCYEVETVKNADGLGDDVSEYVDYCPWLLAPIISSDGLLPLGDLDGDGDVDFEDFAIMAENWLEGA